MPNMPIGKGLLPPKVEVSLAGCISVPSSSPQARSQVLHGGSTVPPYEAPMHGGSGALGPDLLSNQYLMPAHRQTPPPAHQGEVVHHYPPLHMRAAPPAHDLPPPAYPHYMYQQYLRAHQESVLPYNLTTGGIRSPLMSNMDVKPEPEIPYMPPGDVRSPLIGSTDVKVEPEIPYNLAQGIRSPLSDIKQEHRPAPEHSKQQLERVPGEAGEETAAAAATVVTIPPSPPLELRHPGVAPRASHSLQSPSDRATDSPQVSQVYMHGARIGHQYTPRYYESPPTNTPSVVARIRPQQRPSEQFPTPNQTCQLPILVDSLLELLQRYPVMWQGLLALKNDQAAVQMHFVFGNPDIARGSLPYNSDGSTPPLRIVQRMRLEPVQLEGVTRKMRFEKEHCMLLALPCGRDHMDVVRQSIILQNGFITYLQQKQAAGIINVAAQDADPFSHREPAYVVHIFPSCKFTNENLSRIAPDLLDRVVDIAHLFILIATV